jgi:hypothetical protein
VLNECNPHTIQLQEPATRRPAANQNRTGHKANHGQDNHINNKKKEIIVTEKENIKRT